MESTFGTFLTKKRKEQNMTLRGFAKKADISPVYMCNIEKDRKAAPARAVLLKMAKILHLDETSREIFFDLATKSKMASTAPVELTEFIMASDIVRVALRAAKDVEATDKDWQEFIQRIQNRKQNSEV